jgi:hypothetical protein
MLQYSKNQNSDSAEIGLYQNYIYFPECEIVVVRSGGKNCWLRVACSSKMTAARQQLLVPPPLGQISPTATFFSEKERNTNTQQAGTQSVSLEEVE